MPEEKRFDEWNGLKKQLHESGETLVFHEREIRWYAAGENIGREIDGKGARFSRPILIVRRYGAESFFGIPLSTKMHSGRWYAKITIKGVERSALLSQAGTFSAKRLYERIDKVSKEEFVNVCKTLEKLLFNK